MIIIKAQSTGACWLDQDIIFAKKIAKFVLTELRVQQGLDKYKKIYLNLNFADAELLRSLNLQYRNKDNSTDILSFPWLFKVNQCLYLGDIFLSHTDILSHIKKYTTTLEQRLAHLTVHGALHLLKYDHEETHKARIMEELEIDLLHKLGFSNPYA